MSRLFRPVKRRVLEGGVGCTSGGKLERSSVRLDLREADEDDREERGEGSIIYDVVMYIKYCPVGGGARCDLAIKQMAAEEGCCESRCCVTTMLV